jgi:FdhD protein
VSFRSSDNLKVGRLTRRGGGSEERRVAAEVPVAISFNGVGYAVMMATPSDLEDFAVGFARSERLIEAAADVKEVEVTATEQGILLEIELIEDRRPLVFERVRHRIGESSCGLCGIENLDQALRPLPKLRPWVLQTPPEELFSALEQLREHQPLNAETGAVHAAAFFGPQAKLMAAREDVGRHNAFDKLIGHLMRSGLDTSAGFALLTSRCSYELVEKAALAGIGLLVTVSAPTTLAVDRAREAGLTLIALARSDAMLVMTDPWDLYTESETGVS